MSPRAWGLWLRSGVTVWVRAGLQSSVSTQQLHSLFQERVQPGNSSPPSCLLFSVCVCDCVWLQHFQVGPVLCACRWSIADWSFWLCVCLFSPCLFQSRRVTHITAEQKRRFNINIGFKMLSSLIPALKSQSNVKPCLSVICLLSPPTNIFQI